MSELIEKQAAIKAVSELPTYYADSGGYYGGAHEPLEALFEPMDVINTLKTLPTIDVPFEPQWIPCSERLPEEKDYKSCMECLDGAVWYFTENGTMGLGYYYEFTKEWSTTDDLKTDGKVVAWMPLPFFYKGE